MLDIAPTELLLVAVVALVVIGPKDLPKAMRVVGQWIARARGVARHFRSGIDEMIRQSELEEMEKKWAAENERIMREHPPQPTSEAEPQHGDMIAIGSQPGSADTPQTSAEPDDATANAAAADLPIQKPHPQT
jgi:sec-independent protein translocase protein TatB